MHSLRAQSVTTHRAAQSCPLDTTATVPHRQQPPACSRYSASSSGSVIFTVGALCSASISALDSRMICSAVICRAAENTCKRWQVGGRWRQQRRRPSRAAGWPGGCAAACLGGGGLLVLDRRDARQFVLALLRGGARRGVHRGCCHCRRQGAVCCCCRCQEDKLRTSRNRESERWSAQRRDGCLPGQR